MIRFGLALAATSAAMVGSSWAAPAAGQWYLHAGPAVLDLADKADFSLAGSPIPGAGLHTDIQVTGAVEVGRFMTDNIAVGLTVGYPPTAKAEGAGALAGVGLLGETQYGPIGLAATYHFASDGAFQPYVGAGISYMRIFSTKDGAVAGMSVDDTVGPLVQAGFDVMVNDKASFFVDVKKAWLESEATGTFSSLPITATIGFDPMVYHAGIGWRF